MTERTSADASTTPRPTANLIRYGTAVAAVAGALGATLLLQRVLALQLSLLFVAAVLVSALVGGLGPGLVATALATASMNYFLAAPHGSLVLTETRDAIGLLVFALTALVTSTLSERLRAQRERAEARTGEVERLSAELQARAALRLEEKVHEAQALAAELARTNEALQAKTREVESESRAKSRFLAAVSHELKTPLNAIAGYAELIVSGAHGAATDAQRQDVERIRASQKLLLQLINNLLDLERAASGRLPLTLGAVALADVVREACALVEPQRGAKGLGLEVAPLADVPAVRGDRERVLQIVVNVLSNAVKYTDDGRITVSTITAPDRVALAVADTGRGIPPDQLARVFEPFAQVRPEDAREGRGSGLGLAIARDLARAMGGTVTVASAVGVGSTFTLWLPRASPAARPAGDAAGGLLTLWPPVLFVPPHAA